MLALHADGRRCRHADEAAAYRGRIFRQDRACAYSRCPRDWPRRDRRHHALDAVVAALGAGPPGDGHNPSQPLACRPHHAGIGTASCVRGRIWRHSRMPAHRNVHTADRDRTDVRRRHSRTPRRRRCSAVHAGVRARRLGCHSCADPRLAVADLHPDRALYRRSLCSLHRPAARARRVGRNRLSLSRGRHGRPKPRTENQFHLFQ